MAEAPSFSFSIYGSCVSRDTVEFCADAGKDLKRYIARQSLISAFGPEAKTSLDMKKLSSPFQQRMVKEDLNGSLRKLLPKIVQDSEILIWDLVDERLGVYRTDCGGYVTRSFELINSGNDEKLQKEAKLIAFGSDEHFELWVSALQDFAKELERFSYLARVRLIAVPWAEKGTDGTKTPWSHGLSAKQANKLYARYFRAAEELFNVIWIGKERKPLASAEHKWGFAPFHFDHATYLEISKALGLQTSDR